MEGSVLIAGDWRPIPSPDAGALVTRFQDAWLQSLPPGTHPENANIHFKTVRAMPLVCYRRTLLCEVETMRTLNALSIASFLYGPFGIRLIDGQSAVLHELNEYAGVELHWAVQAAAHGRLFCSAVHGSEGRFEVIERHEQLGDAPVSDKTRARIAPMTAERDGGSWQLAAVVRYGNALFTASFRLDQGGLIEMIDDNHLEALEFKGVLKEDFEHPFRLVPLAPEGKADRL